RVYRRNRVRYGLLPKLRAANSDFDPDVTGIIEEAGDLNAMIDRELGSLVASGVKLDFLRHQRPEVIQEIILHMANAAQPGAELDSKAVERLAIDIKTGRFKAVRKLTKRLSATFARGTFTIAFKA